MKVLVGILAAAACIVAEPTPFSYDLPFYRHLYNPITYPINPVVRGLIPDVYPLQYSLPYYAGLKSQYYDRDLIGQARYGHVEPGQNHYAVQDAFGNKVGGFSYYDADGKLKQTSYVADGAGYRVISNNLPKDTPEVVAAKIAHFAEHEKVRLRNRRDTLLVGGRTSPILTPFPHLHYSLPAPIPHAFPTTFTQPIVKPDGFLADTPEVAAAKTLHLAEVELTKAKHFSSISPIIPVHHHIAPLSRYVSPFTPYLF